MKDHLKDHNGNDLSEVRIPLISMYISAYIQQYTYCSLISSAHSKEELFYMVHNIENTFGTSCSNISSRNFGYLESLVYFTNNYSTR